MGSDRSSENGEQDATRLRESVSMVIRQLQQPQQPRARSEEIPESDEEEVEDDVDDGGIDEDDDAASDEGPQRRHSVSSVGSQYSPSVTSEPDYHSLQADPNTQNQPDSLPAFPPTPTPHRRSKQPPPLFSPHSTVPPTPTHTHWAVSSPLKRSHSPSPLDEDNHLPSPRPFKRLRSTPFNHAYLALLNADILDAATRYVPPDTDDDANNLTPSQLGMTYWSEAEKELLFSALGRVGLDNLPAIAARIKTKSELEVAAYLLLLREEAVKEKEMKGGGIGAEDIPAAIELSQACCAALEEAADAVSVRQEGYEEGVERKKWGGEHWLVGVGNWREVERDVPEGMEGSLGLFRVGAWLRLSGRVFMNSAVEEYNWERVEGEEPAIRATALEDFYSIAVVVTRRLVAATIFVGEARVKARRELYPDERNRVRKQDVEAAALSLGLPTNSRRFWAKCARRLRLEVYDDEDGTVESWDVGDGQDPMSYDEVEKVLGFEPESREGDDSSNEEVESFEEEDEVENDPGAESDQGSVELGAGLSDHEKPLSEEDEAERKAVKLEANEALVQSAFEYPKSTRGRAAMRDRIRAERAHEAYADKLDARASYYEEKRLWAMLERQPPMELVKPDVPAEPPKSTKRTVADLLEGFARTPGDWRSKLEVVPSRWEMEYALTQKEKERANAATGAESGDEI